MPFTAYLYAFYLSFCTKMQCILHQNTLRLAPKRVAFSTKTHCIQHQNALRLAAYCRKHSSKHLENGCKWQFLIINIHFAASTDQPIFSSTQTLTRIDFLRPSELLVDKKGTLCVKFLAKKWTKQNKSARDKAVDELPNKPLTIEQYTKHTTPLSPWRGAGGEAGEGWG